MNLTLAAGWTVRRTREAWDAMRGERVFDRFPVPPLRLRARVGAPGERDFVISGRESADEILASLGSVGVGPERLEAVLDFGCGPARVVPHVAERAPNAECFGCDVDPAAIAWATRHHPEIQLSVSAFSPPLPYPDATFDLIYSVSVFSHLDEGLQDRWLTELNRRLRPGGIALLSVHGAYAYEQFRTGAVTTRWCDETAFQRGPLRSEQFAFVPYRRSIWNRTDLPHVGEEYGLAFHGERYVRERWGALFDVRAILPRAMTRWQDIVVLRK